MDNKDPILQGLVELRELFYHFDAAIWTGCHYQGAMGGGGDNWIRIDISSTYMVCWYDGLIGGNFYKKVAEHIPTDHMRKFVERLSSICEKYGLALNCFSQALLNKGCVPGDHTYSYVRGPLEPGKTPRQFVMSGVLCSTTFELIRQRDFCGQGDAFSNRAGEMYREMAVRARIKSDLPIPGTEDCTPYPTPQKRGLKGQKHG